MKKKLLLGLTITVLIWGCAKDNPYETVYKEAELMNKNQVVDTDSKFLYVPSTLGAPKDIEAANAFYQGDEKIVKLKFTEKTLDILEVEKDPRFEENEFNHTPVLSIPVTYKDYRCQVNATTGECQNKEEENTEIPWYSKGYFQPDFAGMVVKEVNSLDLFNLDPGCINLVDTGLVNYEISKEVINIELERTYKVSTSYECIAPLYYGDQLGKAGFKMRFFYSLIRLDKVASSDYEPVTYPIQDQHEFGFFSTTESKLDDVYDPSRPEENHLLHRWNPKRDSVTYYLSKNFNKPENKILKDATYRAFEQLNKGLKKANVHFTLKLEEPKDGVTTGDLRYNSINLIDDPLSNGLLGYGPTVVNPLTGEIVQGHVNMYGGVLTSTVRSVYEAMVDLSIERRNTSDKDIITNSTNLLAVTEIDKKFFKNNQLTSLLTGIRKPISATSLKKLESYKNKSSVLAKQRMLDMHKLSLAEAKLPVDKTDLATLENKKLAHFGKQGACSAELISVPELAKKEFAEITRIEGIRNEDGTLKPWTALSKAKQLEVKNAIMPNIYMPTLIHEMGHNLGLRHNFMGSYDKNNFYTNEEAQNLGLHSTPVFSSIMDYGYSELNSLNPYLGKYDIAALRFGYAREVLTQDNQVIPLNETLLQTKTPELKFKEYGFCTDENAGLSIRCNRFDEGTSQLEIAFHHQKIYLDGYKYRNFRNGRAEFSDYGIANAVASRNSMFRAARLVYEEYEFFESIFGTEIMEQGCTPEMIAKYPICIDINDHKDATLLVGKMFLDILKTPDLTCAVADSADPTQTKELVKLSKIYQDELRFSMDYVPTSCFDPKVKNYFTEKSLIVKGEAGKFFNSIKDPNPIYPYATDIAVRGIWFDKLLAMKMLTTRYFGNTSTEDLQGSMIDITSIREELINYIEHITLGAPLNQSIPFLTETGASYQGNYSIDGTYLIPEQPLNSVIKYLNLPQDSNVELPKQELLIAAKASKTTDVTKKDAAKSFIASISIYKSSIIANQPAADVKTFKTDEAVYAATSNNVIANYMFDTIGSLDFLNSLDPELILKVYKIKTGDFEFPADFTNEEKKATQLPLDLLSQLYKLSLDNAQLDLAFLIERFGEDMGNLIYTSYMLGSEKLLKVITFIQTATQAPADADENTKKLYAMDVQILEDFLTQQLPIKVGQFIQALDYLPVLR